MSSSDSDSESDTDSGTNIGLHNGLDGDEHSDEEDPGVAPPKGTYFQTKNELLENEIVIPDIQHVEPEEHLEKVGEIMSVVGNMAIVKAVLSDVPNRGAERALDSNTLLVFEDRSVMGYVSNPWSHSLSELDIHVLDIRNVWADVSTAVPSQI